MTADLRCLVKKIVEILYPSLYKRQRNLKKTLKNGMSTPLGLHFTPVQCLPPKPLVTPLCVWGSMGDVITRAQYQLNRFRG